MSEATFLVEMCGVVSRLPNLRFEYPINWEIKNGQQWALIGPNGSGKTLIADFIQRRHAIKDGFVRFAERGDCEVRVRSIAFKDIYSLTDCRNSFYQQRWHSSESDDCSIVADLIKDIPDSEEKRSVLATFNMDEQLHKKLIYLSSGELRKFLVVRTLLSVPDILILDNPFIGLDSDSRAVLIDLLRHIIRFKHTHIVLLLSNPADIPDFITDVLPLKNRQCYPPMTRADFVADVCLIEELFPTNRQSVEIPAKGNASAHEVTLRMEDVTIKYGERTILSGLNWEVKNGEKWSLTGVNGSGKSTLLSLVYADNPQSYANTFYLFDKKRGSGESIWDIKRRIGYVSPEIHLYYNENVSAEQIVGSGFFDSIGLFRKCTDEQLSVAYAWMHIFGIEHLKDRLFLTLSSGEQRLMLLARALVKNPDLLVLDEPLHGLDYSNKQYVARIIEKFCSLPGKTLIYVTHYPDELPSCVSKHFVLKKSI